MQNNIFLSLLIAFTLTSCGPKSTDVKGYLKYVQDPANGLVQEKEVDGILFKVTWVPAEWMALNEIKKLSIDKKEWNKVMSEYEGLVYCKLSVQSLDNEYIHTVLKAEQIDATATEAHLNLVAQEDLQLIAEKDTASCVLYSYAVTYGLAKEFNISAGFNRKDSVLRADYTLDWDVSFLNRGLLKFRFKQEDINRIPLLNI